ncbi:hypothetical protein OUZ56_029928 [Daphnia magna]|uniref:DUF5667 domain-containing protein n=1 Tax=Daphnia magna TaxID=35525 RepID=A0ABR0B880_9CRUS|nr:hypothetical protein OUZ56_029928 [Daphnia magna]
MYLPNEEVLVYKPIRKVSKSEKLLHRWFGPYTVVRQTTQSNYELRLGKSPKTEICCKCTKNPVPSEDLQENQNKGPEKEASANAQDQEQSEETNTRPSEENGTQSETAEINTDVPTVPPTRQGRQETVQMARAENAGIRRSARIAQRKTVMLTLPLMLLLSVMSGPTTSKEILAYQGVIFKSEGEIAISDSEWVVVTDFTFNPLETVIKTLHDVLGRKVNTLNFRYEGPNDGLKKRIKEEVEERARAELKNLKKSQERLRELKQAVNIGSTRKKRGLIDGGGKVLNWLFGVSTEEDLEHVNNHVEKLSTETTSIAHALEVHASLINETLWETKATSNAVEELQNAFEKLEREAWKTDHKIDGITQEVEKHEIARAAIENTFPLAWLDESIEDFAVGLATMAMERLPALLFPPMQIQAVLKEIKAILPSGWSLSPSIQMGDTWQVYKDAKVAVAAIEDN